MATRTEPLLPFYYIAPRSNQDFEEAPTLLLVRRRPRSLPPQWNPPLPLAAYETSVFGTPDWRRK